MLSFCIDFSLIYDDCLLLQFQRVNEIFMTELYFSNHHFFKLYQSRFFVCLIAAQECDDMIVLENGFKFPVEGQATMDNKLLIRKADKHLWKLFENAILNKGSINGHIYRHLMVLGPEGTGKVCSFITFNFFNEHNSNDLFFALLWIELVCNVLFSEFAKNGLCCNL